MKKLFALTIAAMSLLSGVLFAQQAVVNGRVTGLENQPLQFVNIAVKGTTTGATTNKDGVFEMTVAANQDLVILFSYIGYESDSLRVKLKEGERRKIDHTMEASSTQLESIEVKDQQLRTNTFSRLDPKVLTLIPTINASVEDLIKTLPGVSSRNELSSQYSVRGGNYDENLVFVNDIEIYRPFLVRSGQQEGQSFLNPDLVSGISFSAGGFEAKFGDKMSSVLDIRYKKPTEFAASFDVSFLGATAHVEGLLAKKLSYLIGTRYKSNTYIFKDLDTEGDYKPRFFDIQGILNYEISKKVEVSFFGTFTNNVYDLIPTTRETTFGTLDQSYQITMYMDGRESDQYQNWMTAATVTWKPVQDVRMKFIASAYRTFEAETYDISSEYWLGKLEVFQGSTEGEVTEVMGVGAYLQHARNYLDGTVFNLEHRGTLDKGKSTLAWGVKYQHDSFIYTNNEWELQDSAGYSLPHPPDSLGVADPPHPDFVLYRFMQNYNSLVTNRISAFLQDTWTFKNESNDISLTAGLRAIYYDYNGQFLLNPRINLSFKPHWQHETVFRLSTGIYSQPPTFREMTDQEGKVVTGLNAQTSYQVVVGSDYYFKAWNRPFKFIAEAYYKYIDDLIPYEIDNMTTRYYGTNDAHGYAAGIDFRVHGEFVKGAESWASLSFLKTEEYFEGSWIPRPTDQRMNLAIFFQDYIPGFPTWKMNLTLVYGTGLPFGPPDSPRSEQTLRMPPYRRVDIGLSKQLIGQQTSFSAKNPLRAFESVWISLDIFNLLQFSNTVSYLWVTDINENQYAVPNYLTPRTFNLKLTAKF